MQKPNARPHPSSENGQVTVPPADLESLRLEHQRLLDSQHNVQRNLADLSGELLNLARLLEQELASLQNASAQCPPSSTLGRSLAQALSHNQTGITQLHRTQQSLTHLRVSLTPVPSNSPKREHLNALLNVSQALNSTLDLNELLDLTLDIVIEATGAQRGFLMLYEDNVQTLEPVLRIQVARNVDRQSITGPEFGISRSIIDRVAATGEPILTTNALADPRFATQASVITHGLRSILCVALSVKERVTGVIYVDSRARAGLFSIRDLDFLVGFANQGAMAIENARLYQAVSSGYLDTIKA
ncbi:MAG: GAF domain-containing protein, partial [Chloroflexi bacterium]|nr:GAF domain-containing protein [Chloroflexota bacterium]